MHKDQGEVVEIAEDLLSHRFGGSQQLGEVEVLAGSGNALVLRARVANSPFLQHRSVVVKYNPETGHPVEDAALLREVVAYQFTTSLPEEVRPGPVLLAHDIEQRIVVLTDAGDGSTLIDVLDDADDERRIQVIRSLGTELGRMHAGTAEREAHFDALLHRQLRNFSHYGEHQTVRDAAIRESIFLGLDILRSAGIEPPAEFVQQAEYASSVLLAGSERAFTPFDLSPDNIIVSKKIDFLDYEWAGFRNVGFDVASVISGFPQFLFSRPISDAEVDILINAWSREVQETWPHLGREESQHELITASMIGWALASIATMYAGGLEELVVLTQTERSPLSPEDAAWLRAAEEGPFSEDEELLRRDLYETFEALSRFTARGRGDDARAISDFSAQLVRRLMQPED